MKVYLAGTPGQTEREILWRKLLKHRLLSYWDILNDQFAVYDAFKLAYNVKKKRNKKKG